MFLATMRRRNPALISAAARLHADGRVPAGSYVVDLDTVAANARLVSDAARGRGLVCWQMTKQFGRNPLVAQAVAAGGVDGVVAVEMAEARVLHAHGLRIGHVGHLVQVPRHELAEALSFAPEHLTVFGVDQAAAVGAAARAAGVVQQLLLRVVRARRPLLRGPARRRAARRRARRGRRASTPSTAWSWSASRPSRAWPGTTNAETSSSRRTWRRSWRPATRCGGGLRDARR